MEDLEKLIPLYGDVKEQSDTIKKEADALNKKLKSIMDEGSYEVGEWVATKSISERRSMNEDKLVECLKRNGYANLISTIEVVDSDALEKAMYAKEIDADTIREMGACEEVKEVCTLKIKKRKVGKKDE